MMNYYNLQPLPDHSSCPSHELLVRSIAQPLTLSEKESDQLLDHLFGCPQCLELYDALQDVAEQFYKKRAQAEGRELFAPTMTTKEAIADVWRRIKAGERRVAV